METNEVSVALVKPAGLAGAKKEEQENGRGTKESAHSRCLNCHIDRHNEKKPHGPLNCKGCHWDRPRSAGDLANALPPEYSKKDRILIRSEKATMAAVPFDHKLHVAASRSCSDCHHKTLASCSTCHTVSGTRAGKFITLWDAYHGSGSTLSCVGCHEQEQKRPDCTGCHHLRKGGLVSSSCKVCHTGTLESLDQAARLPDPASLFPRDLKDEFEIAILEKEYEPTKVKHAAIIRALTAISNNSKLATFFHRNETTMCVGCHHMGPVKRGKHVPACGACHTSQNMPSSNIPTLLGAYHQACLGCHIKMGHPEKEMPQNCTGCHKKKLKQPQRVP